MSSSSTPATSSKLFTKRRRAYVACVTCRKRKIKCVTVSDADYQPCTRCAQKGLKCEYIAVPDEDDSGTSSPDAQGPSRRSGWGGSSQPGITPPSAGIAPYLNSSFAPPRGSSRSPAPRAGTSSPYPPPGAPSYPYRPNAMRSSGSYDNAQFPGAQYQDSNVPYVSGLARASSLHMQGYAQPGSQFSNPGPTPYPSAPSGNFNSGSFYNLNTDDQYAQSSNAAYHWPQALPPTECICPPGGPCYCGANFNAFSTR